MHHAFDKGRVGGHRIADATPGLKDVLVAHDALGFGQSGAGGIGGGVMVMGGAALMAGGGGAGITMAGAAEAAEAAALAARRALCAA
jgi:hypothetical protein